MLARTKQNMRGRVRADVFEGVGIATANSLRAQGYDTGANLIHCWRGGKGEIDDAVVDKRAAVGDAHHRGLAVAQVGDADHGLEWQRAVRRGEFIHVVDLAVRGAPPVKRLTVPGSVAFLRVTGGSRRGSGLAALRSWRRRRRRRLAHIGRALRGLSGCRRCFRWLRRRRLAAIGDRFARCAAGRINAEGAESTEHTEHGQWRTGKTREATKSTLGNALARIRREGSCFHWTVQCAACVMWMADSAEGARREGAGRQARYARRCAL